MNEIVEIGPWRLASAYLFLVILLFLVNRQGIGREKEIFISAMRMTVQLIAVGYLLVYIFEQKHVAVTLLVLVVMQFFAIRNIYGRVKVPIKKKLRHVIILSLVTGTGATIFYFLSLVINIEPWYEPRYFIPIAGMIIGNSMTGISIGAERMIDEMKSKKEMIEGALMLGATPRDATAIIVKNSFTAAIMPAINTMVGMGIVFLPGMMTGQILAGLSPLVAIEYQIAIMLSILGSVTITVFILTRLGYTVFFNRWSQLEENDL
ncbi:MAG: iron export ABC transporter permease subunit FetB [Bacillota bacterium]